MLSWRGPVEGNVTQATIDEGRTTRERVEIHPTAERSLSCHQLIDGIGFGYEEFDASGDYRKRLAATASVERRATSSAQ